jgi:hypothetical protein
LIVMRFLMDENVDDAVGKYLSSLGHEVTYSRDVLNASAPDAMLLHLSLQFGLIVVTHDRDFKRLAKQVPQGLVGAVRRGAGRIQIAVSEDQAIARLAEIIDEICVNYELALRKQRRFLAQISATQVSYITNALLEGDAEKNP